MPFTFLLLYIFIGHLFEGHDSSSECIPEACLKCNNTGPLDVGDDVCTMRCANATSCLSFATAMENNCTRDIKVVIKSSASEVEEAERVVMSCSHNIPKKHILSYTWMMDKATVYEGNKSRFIILKTFSQDQGLYTCAVHSLCGNYTSGPQRVTIHNNNIIILAICGCSALTLVIIMGLFMKIKLHRDKVKNKRRGELRLQEMRRALDLQNRGLPPIPTPTKAPYPKSQEQTEDNVYANNKLQIETTQGMQYLNQVCTNRQ